MLRPDYERTFKKLMRDHPSTIIVPRHIQLDMERRGADQSAFDDVRVSPRFRCTGPTIVEWIESPVALPLQMPAMQGIIRNVSRTGFSVLVDRQWFPDQVCRLYLPIAVAQARVMRATRLGLRCYDIGMRVLSYQTMT